MNITFEGRQILMSTEIEVNNWCYMTFEPLMFNSTFTFATRIVLLKSFKTALEIFLCI